MKRIFCSLLVFISTLTTLNATPQYYCTASDDSNYQNLLNLIGSIHETNFDQLEQINVFDLGMTKEQKQTLSTIKKVNVTGFNEQNPNILVYFTFPSGGQVQGWHIWKPIAIKETLEVSPYTLWIEPSAVVLKPLDDLFTYIQQNGYLLLTIGDELQNGVAKHPLKKETTAFLIEQFNLTDPTRDAILSKEPVMSSLVGVSRRGYTAFSRGWYDLTKDLRYFADDGSAPGGYGTGRYAQTVLSLLAYTKDLEVLQQDYQQKVAMKLSISNQQVPFYVTWNSSYADKRTHILTLADKINKCSSIRYN